MQVKIMHVDAVSIVVPVYKSTESVRELCDGLHQVLPSACNDFEVLLVDDGNSSDVSRYLDALVPDFSFVKVIHLSKNFGQHNAILAGVNQAKYSVVVTMDDDLQHAPGDVPAMLQALESHIDIVYGVPVEQPHGWIRGVLSRTVKRIISDTSSAKHIGYHSAFRAFRRSLVPTGDSIRQPSVNIDQILSWASNRVTKVELVHNPRKYGESNYTSSRLVKHAIYLILNFTTWPLRLSSLLGMLSCGVSLLILVYVVMQRLLTGATVPGFAFLASSVSFFGGIQLLSIGVIGEYISQIFTRTSDQPTFSIRNIVKTELRPSEG